MPVWQSMAAAGRAALRRSHRASDRHADGKAAPAARDNIQQRTGVRRIQLQAARTADFEGTRALHRPRYRRLLSSVDPQLPGPPADCGLAEHEGEIPLRLPQDRLRFWLTFLPEQERTLRPTGIHLFGLRYWSAALSADVGRSDRRLLVKYDPRDLARIFVRRPSGNFVEARYADVTLPSITLHEALTARRTLLAKGRREVDTRAIVRTAMAQREQTRRPERQRGCHLSRTNCCHPGSAGMPPFTRFHRWSCFGIACRRPRRCARPISI